MKPEQVTILGTTESLCPICLKRISAVRIGRRDDVYLQKTCPEHGAFRTIIWRGQPSYQSWGREKMASRMPEGKADTGPGCPFECGLCPSHRQRTCCVLLEVTRRCNLHCPVCFAETGTVQPDPELATIEGWFRTLLDSGGPCHIQLSGGEPSLRDDLPDIIRLGRSMGFSFFQLNTNGLRLAEDVAYVRDLKEAGLNTVFLQFDGLNFQTYQTIRGKDLLAVKQAAIANCAEQQLGIILVPTLVPGVNIGEIGSILQFALEHMPAVRGVHFQPVSYFGRYPAEPADESRITIPEVLRAIEQQTGGKIRAKHFQPPSAENAYCSFNGNFLLQEDGQLQSYTKSSQCCCQPQAAAKAVQRAQNFVAKHWSAPLQRDTAVEQGSDSKINVDSLEDFLERAEQFTFCISGMAFQDVWNMDLERLQECFIHVVSPDAKIIPFCAYNLTDSKGRSLYRPQGAE